MFVSHACYLDDARGVAVTHRSIMEALARRGQAVEVLCGPILGLDTEADLTAWLGGRGWVPDRVDGESATPDPEGDPTDAPPHLRLTVRGIRITLHRGPSTLPHEPADAERDDFLRLFETVAARFQPDVVIAGDGSRPVRDVLARAKARGAATAFLLHDFAPRDPSSFAAVDAVLVPSQFAADYFREALGLSCTVLPRLVDPDRVRAERRGPGHVTFIDPTPERGVWAFARIADEMGRRRPDIPLLVVEGRGTEATLAGCGLDLRAHGTVGLMAPPPHPRDYWAVTRICLLPSLGWEGQLSAAEALVNGIPVVASDRGDLPETLGGAGVVLPLPERLTPVTRIVLTAEEVAPWVEAIIRLWDDEGEARDHRRRALAGARRWAPEVLEAQYVRSFADLRPGAAPPVAVPPRRSKAVVLVPHLGGIEWECEQSLRRLEAAGVRVVRRGGSSAIDVARNALMSDALHDGFEAMMFIDADIGFDPQDVLRLLARPELVVAGIYVKKGERALASHFAEGVVEVLFGPDAAGLYPLQFAATGFLRVKAAVLRKMIDELGLPLCNTKWGRGAWPFFMPMIVPHDAGKLHYLGEDWAFSHRLSQIGVTPLADTTIRLWHWGRYGYSWEDAGTEVSRYRSYNYRLGGR